MKKFFILAVLTVMTVAANAQLKSYDVKGDLRSDLGLGLGVTYGITDQINFAPSFNYYFVDNGHFMTLDADFHYDYPVATDFTAYPIVGATIMNAGVKGFDSSTKLGVDLGAGVKYNVVDNIGLFLEFKYQWIDGWDDTYFSLGVNIGI